MQITEQLRPLATSIERIQLDPKNARLHSELNLNTIKKSLEVYGQRKPIVVNKNTGFIEAGNGLYIAAKTLGWQEIAAVYVDDDKDAAFAYGLMDNKSALLADWDLPNLKEILNELDSKAFNISSTGFSSKEIKELLNQVIPEHNMSSQLSKGYVEGVDQINTLKLAFRLESICHCSKRNLAIELFAGKGRLSFWYKRLFDKVVRIDKENYSEVDYCQNAESFLKEHLAAFINFDFIDFDDEGCPGKELQLFFSLIEGKSKPFVLCLTDGMGLALKIRAKINLYNNYLFGRDEVIKVQDDSQYRDFDQYVKHLIDTLCTTHGFNNKIINWYRGADGNVIYACFEIAPKMM